MKNMVLVRKPENKQNGNKFSLDLEGEGEEILDMKKIIEKMEFF